MTSVVDSRPCYFLFVIFSEISFCVCCPLQKTEDLEVQVADLRKQLDAQRQENDHLAKLTVGTICKCPFAACLGELFLVHFY